MVMRRQPVGAELDRIITEMLDRGDAVTDISHHCGMRVHLIRTRMSELGLQEAESAGHAIHPMWKTENMDERRYAIWKRQHDGAAQTRRELDRELRDA